MTVPSMGYAAQLGMDPSSTTATEKYEFLSESIGAERAIVNTAGMRGSRSEQIERIRQGIVTYGGSIVLAPSPTELRKLLPRILGAAEGSDTGFYTYALADTLPSFYVAVDRVTKVFLYSGVVVDKATFRSSAGSPLELTLDVEALTESIGNAGTFPALSVDGYPPFMHHDLTLTLSGSSVQCHEITLTIDNMLKKDRFGNSQTRTDLLPTGRKVTIQAVVPYTSDTIALYDTAAAGVSCDVKWSFGGAGDGAAGKDLHFLCQNVVFPANKTPVMTQKGDEITLTIEGQIYKSGSNNEISAKLDVVA